MSAFLASKAFHRTLRKKSPPDRRKIRHSIRYVGDVDQNMRNVDENELAGRFNIVKIMCKRNSEWNSHLMKFFERWSRIFEFA